MSTAPGHEAGVCEEPFASRLSRMALNVAATLNMAATLNPEGCPSMSMIGLPQRDTTPNPDARSNDLRCRLYVSHAMAYLHQECEPGRHRLQEETR